MIYVSCQFETPIGRSDYSDYVRSLQLDVLGYDAGDHRVIETTGTLFGDETVVAMWRGTSGLSDAELAALGFRRIAESELVYQHSGLRSAFSDEHPCGMDVPLEFEADESDEEWVLQEWNKGELAIPDDEA